MRIDDPSPHGKLWSLIINISHEEGIGFDSGCRSVHVEGTVSLSGKLSLLLLLELLFLRRLGRIVDRPLV